MRSEHWQTWLNQSNYPNTSNTTDYGSMSETSFGFVQSLSPYGTIADLQSDRFSIYLQDAWTIGDKLTINYGVRLDKEDLPSMDMDDPDASYSFDFFDKITPRVGFAYDLSGDANTKLFGSFGLDFDATMLNMDASAFGGLHWRYWNEFPTFNTYADPNKGYNYSGSASPVQGGHHYIDASQWNALSDIVPQPVLAPARGQITPRDQARTPWRHRIDIRLIQSIPIPGEILIPLPWK